MKVIIAHAAAIVIASMTSLGSVLAVDLPFSIEQNTPSAENSAKTYNDMPPDVHRRINRFLDIPDMANVANVNHYLRHGIRRDFLPWNRQDVEELAQACGSKFKSILNWLAGNQQSRYEFDLTADDEIGVNQIVQCFSVIKKLKNPSGRTIPFEILVAMPGSVNLTPLLNDFGPVRMNMLYYDFYLDEEYLGALSKALIRYNSIEELIFSDNIFDEKGIIVLAKALKENKSLRKLSITSFDVSRATAGPLAKALGEALKENKNLEQLQMEHIPFGNEGARALANGLKRNNALQQLTLYRSEIGSRGTRALADALKENHSLQQLSLRLNEIGQDGAVAIAEFLKENESLRLLNLQANQIGSAGAQALAEALRENSALQTLSLQSNQIDSDGVVDIANAIKENKGLRYLDLRFCHIGTSGALALAESLKENKSLQRLFVDVESTNPAGKHALEKVLRDAYVIKQMVPQSA